MKKYLSIVILFSWSLITYAQVGIQTNTPDASSALDIVATDKGLLIPRVTLTNDLTSASPVTAPAIGLLVFNIAAPQPVGLYFWDGASWNLFNAGAISSDYWNLTGNAGTTVGTNFIGTTDAEDFAFYTDNTERMRINEDGQVLVGLTSASFASDFVTIEGNATQNYALNITSPYVGAYVDATNYAFCGIGGTVALRGVGGTYGVYATATSRGVLGRVDANAGSGGWFENQAAVDGNGEGSWGAFFIGSGLGGFTLQNHSAGLSSTGNDGVFAAGKATDGTGIIAGGNGVSTFSTLPTGAGGAFTGYHGVYGSAIDATAGTGIIGVGNDHGTYNTVGTGSGGSFTGHHGIISTAFNASGTGVIGVGNGGGYILYTGGNGGSGGAFTGEYCGVAGWSTVQSTSSRGVYGYYNGGGNTNGVGVFGYSRPANNRGYGVYGYGNKYGVYGVQGTAGSSNYGVYANGNSGASGTKSFAIDHPLDPENKFLKHFSVESPEVLNMYRGNVILNANGEASVQLPDYFHEININFSYSLTPIGQKAPDLHIKTEIDGKGRFSIAGGSANQKISWIVYAERNDRYMRQAGQRAIEIEKDEDEKGKYLMPELYNQPPEKGINYTHENSANITVKQKTVSNNSVKVKAVEVKSENLETIDKKKEK